MKQLIIAAAVSATLLSGCVISIDKNDLDEQMTSDWQLKHKENRHNIAHLKGNESYQDILNTLGTPAYSERLSKNDAVFQVLFYPTQSLHSDGKMSKDECTPLVFKDGMLQGWGDAIYKTLL